MKNLRLFGTDGTEEFAARVAKYLGQPLTQRTERLFSDAEPYIKSVGGPSGNVRASDCYIISSLFSDDRQSVNDKFVKALFFAGSLKDASASRVTLVLPYLAYQRQDRKTESRAGIYTAYTAKLLAAMQVDRVITMDVHNLAATQSAMSMTVRFDNLEAKNLLADFICGGKDRDGLQIDRFLPEPLSESIDDDIVVLAPDSGGVGRAKRFRNALETRLKLSNKIPVVHLDKERKASGELTKRRAEVSGNVKGKRVIVYDDMIASGGTIQMCEQSVTENGGVVWAVCATHGLFTPGSDGTTASETLKNIPRLIVTDTVPPFRLPPSEWEGRLHICRTTDVFAEAIRRTHYEGGSISELLE